MFFALKQVVRVALSSPSRSVRRGQHGLVSLALIGAILGEIVLCGLIITRIAYTEIDWVAYMQEVQGFLDGERNYFHLRGDTGPLVYPAGFVYVYSLMYWLTDRGEDIATAQYMFLGVYVSLMMLVLSIYRRAGSNAMPLWSMLLVCASRRVHSIFVLRLFNDGISMWLLYAAVYLFIMNRWRWGCVSFSLAVGVKMNILLFAPGLLLLLLQANGAIGTAVCLGICAGVQLLLGAPFLLRHPVAYLARSFELGRVFKFEWTVNLKFLGEEVFVSPAVSVALLALTAVTLALFGVKWVKATERGKAVAVLDSRGGKGLGLKWGKLNTDLHKGYLCDADGHLLPEYVVKTLFVSNFIGIVFCRSLHYQFYSWYYHALPFLLWQTGYPVVIRLALLMGVEFGYNVFPATPVSSAVLQVCHLMLLAALWAAPVVRRKEAVNTEADSKTE